MKALAFLVVALFLALPTQAADIPSELRDEAARLDMPKSEVMCLALNIYHEARNEPRRGRVAVANVVLNRVADHRYPDTICGVVKQKASNRRNMCQFSWYCDGRSDQPRNGKSWTRSFETAVKVLEGRSPLWQDQTEGALWYHATYVKPYWRRSVQVSTKIGDHIFYRDKPKGPPEPTEEQRAAYVPVPGVVTYLGE